MLQNIKMTFDRIFRMVIYWVSRKISWFDRTNRLDTETFVNKEDLYDTIDSANKEFMNKYEPTDARQFSRICSQLKIIDDTIQDYGFIDYGCGKGRVLVLAQRMGFKHVIGVEFSRNLYEICKKNMEREQLSDVGIHCVDAVHYKLSGDIRTFYFFNPFQYNVLKEVLKKIKDYIITKHYDGYIVYVCPRDFEKLDPAEYELLFQDGGNIQPFQIYKILK